jgi:hypothetical protein
VYAYPGHSKRRVASASECCLPVTGAIVLFGTPLLCALTVCDVACLLLLRQPQSSKLLVRQLPSGRHLQGRRTDCSRCGILELIAVLAPSAPVSDPRSPCKVTSSMLKEQKNRACGQNDLELASMELWVRLSPVCAGL